MADEWFYVEDGKSLGPVSSDELGRRIASARGEPRLVWAPGMPEWVDARTLPQFSTKPGSVREPRPAATIVSEKSPGAPWHKTLFQRARHELIAYLAVSAYLMVWFAAVMFYKSTILRSVGIEFAPFGLAVVKALILGKFIVTLEAVKLGERKPDDSVLIVQILKKALLFTVALLVLSLIEELIVGHLHGRGAREVLGEIAGGTYPQVIASAVLMFLVLLPYLAFRRIALEIGELPELLFTRRTLKKKE